MDYSEKLGRVEGLRRGFTSGTCAQAAALAAAKALLEQRTLSQVTVRLPSLSLTLPVKELYRNEERAAYSILKDSGDDDDISHGKEFCCEVSYSERPGVEVLGGKGVGVVTKEGLALPVGSPAINPGPRDRIISELSTLIDEKRGLRVIVSVPEGEELAKRTWNPRLGIEGGLSIIGSSGIIEPRSSDAYRRSIAVAIRVVRKAGNETIYLLSGYVGQQYVSRLGIDEQQVVLFGDHVGYSLKKASDNGFSRVVLCAHIGKLAKVAAGIFDTHSKYGDARLETISAHAALQGADRDTIRRIMDFKTAEEAASLLKERGLQRVFDSINRSILQRCSLLVGKPLPLRSIILDLSGEVLSDLGGDDV